MARATIKALVLTLLLADGALAVGIDWVTVGDAGNACDQQSNGCFGDVAYAYRISEFEVTVAQYTEFLNSVAASDPTGLHPPGFTIQRTGSTGSYSYSVYPGRENRPVMGVSFYDSLRFVNWLENGQPTGARDATTTEDGAYALSAAASVGACSCTGPGPERHETQQRDVALLHECTVMVGPIARSAGRLALRMHSRFHARIVTH